MIVKGESAEHTARPACPDPWAAPFPRDPWGAGPVRGKPMPRRCTWAQVQVARASGPQKPLKRFRSSATFPTCPARARSELSI
jgi:hypothetical protein